MLEDYSKGKVMTIQTDRRIKKKKKKTKKKAVKAKPGKEKLPMLREDIVEERMPGEYVHEEEPN